MPDSTHDNGAYVTLVPFIEAHRLDRYGHDANGRLIIVNRELDDDYIHGWNDALAAVKRTCEANA